MAGHSKWHSIRHKKGANDAKRGKIFTKHARLITLAARNGDDPDLNSQLRAAIDNARAENVPNDNIQRAIAKAGGAGSDTQMFEMTYEAYGPNGIAFLIEAITDNKNRTVTSVRTILNKNGGSLGESGSVAYMFNMKGVVSGSGDVSGDDLQMELLENGALDIEADGDDFIIYTEPGQAVTIRNLLENKNVKVESAKIAKIAENIISVDDETVAEKVTRLVEKLEEDDDVTDVYTSCDLF